MPDPAARGGRSSCQVSFDGALIVDGENNHPTRPSPFIRNDIEK